MTPDEAKLFGIKNDAERKLFVRFDSAKVNICPPAAGARWFKLVGIDIGNGTDRYPHGDNVQTAEQWTPPDLWKGVSCELLNRILDDIDAGMADGRRYSNHHKAADNGAWTVVQRHIEGRTKEEGREMVKVWLENGVLVEKSYEDPKSGKDRTGLYLSPDPSKRPGAGGRS
jgi:hypothetical protein